MGNNPLRRITTIWPTVRICGKYRRILYVIIFPERTCPDLLISSIPISQSSEYQEFWKFLWTTYWNTDKIGGPSLVFVSAKWRVSSKDNRAIDNEAQKHPVRKYRGIFLTREISRYNAGNWTRDFLSQ